jgi:basic membrane protein A
MTQVFISYSRKDLEFVQRLTQDLQSAGLDVWYDLSGLEVGTHWGREIQEAIQKSQFIIIVLSPDSVKSEWVEREFIYASNRKLKVIPLIYKPCELPLWSVSIQSIDLHGNNYEKVFPELLRVLKGEDQEAGKKKGAVKGAVSAGASGSNRKLQIRRRILVWAVAAILLVAVIALGIWGLPPLAARLKPAPTLTDSATSLPTKTAPSTEGLTIHEDCTKIEIFCVGFVVDFTGTDDPHNSNAIQLEGIQRAHSELNVYIDSLFSPDASQYESNLERFASLGYDLIIASSNDLAGPLANVAAQYPTVKFFIYDITFPNDFVPPGTVGQAECIPNVMGLVYKTDQAAYLAGYLAAGMVMARNPDDPKLGIFGGANMPGVTTYNVGYQQGMEAYNAAHAANVALLGWSNLTGEGSFTQSFVNLEPARQVAENLAQDGADVLMAVSFPYQPVGLSVAQEQGLLAIGVDSDGYEGFDNSRSALLTSVRKRADNVIYDLIARVQFGNFDGCSNYVADISNGGVDLAPYHDLDAQIPAELKAELDELENKIRYGEITDTGCISYPDWCTSGLYSKP